MHGYNKNKESIKRQSAKKRKNKKEFYIVYM